MIVLPQLQYFVDIGKQKIINIIENSMIAFIFVLAVIPFDTSHFTMTHIQQTLQKIDNIDLTKDDAIDTIYKIVSTELRKLPIFMTGLVVGEPLVRSRYLTDKEDFHHTIQDYSYNPFPEYI